MTNKTSKFMSLVLRHTPEVAGLTLDSGGWVRIDELLRGLKKAGHTQSLEGLLAIVAENDKKRFTVSEDGLRIRAAQGHSVEIDLQLAPAVPPDQLYHGTASATLDSIFASGLKPQTRQHVHLSTSIDTAIAVGSRHGKPTVLRVDALRMHGDGVVFWVADNGVWLTDFVDPKYLGFA